VRLTTHVLDTARGLPAAGVVVALIALDGEPRMLAQTVTNADGRTDEPLGVDLDAGRYELVFTVAPYFAERNVAAFYDTIPIRVRLANGGRDYHVPLLLSPWGYSTYRGS
jgi:hydroxyisourate hydrolase